MATKQIYWDDGTPDVMTVSVSGTEGSADGSVSSGVRISPFDRQQQVFFKSSGGDTLDSATVVQKGAEPLFYDGSLRPNTFLFLTTTLKPSQ